VTIELGLAQGIDAETFGQPGQRTFRLRIIGAAYQSASLWMEKEQFQALSLALAQALAQLDYDGPVARPDMEEFPEVADVDFKVGRMALGVDMQDKTVVLYASDILSNDESDPTLQVRISPAFCAGLRDLLDEIISRGRPVCPLCRLPIESSGHACIRGNGHSQQPIPAEEPQEDEEE
jgi:uncharacterized repeat protein (TIGR03847 family)